MTIVVKICGLRSPEMLDAALAAGADMVGFVFFVPSPRNLAFADARALGERRIEHLRRAQPANLDDNGHLRKAA